MLRLLPVCGLLTTLLFPGCGDKSSSVPKQTPEEAFALTVKQMVQDLHTIYKDEGLGGLKNEMVNATENLENWESEELGDHKETYSEIVNGIQELKKLVDGSKTAAIKKKLAELKALADKLPGKLEDVEPEEQEDG